MTVREFSSVFNFYKTRESIIIYFKRKISTNFRNNKPRINESMKKINPIHQIKNKSFLIYYLKSLMIIATSDEYFNNVQVVGG